MALPSASSSPSTLAGLVSFWSSRDQASATSDGRTFEANGDAIDLLLTTLDLACRKVDLSIPGPLAAGPAVPAVLDLERGLRKGAGRREASALPRPIGTRAHRASRRERRCEARDASTGQWLRRNHPAFALDLFRPPTLPRKSGHPGADGDDRYAHQLSACGAVHRRSRS